MFDFINIIDTFLPLEVNPLFNAHLKIFSIFVLSSLCILIFNKILEKFSKIRENNRIKKEELNESKKDSASNIKNKNLIDTPKKIENKSFFKDVILNRNLFKIVLFFTPILITEYYFKDNAPYLILYDESRYSWSNLFYLSEKILSIAIFHKVTSLTVSHFKKIERYQDKPLDGFAQISFIIFLVFLLISMYVHYTSQSAITLFTTLSVVSMATFLTLKDIILGIVSTILIMTNDIVRVGDWIKQPKYSADGHIIEISLVTVKVKNFDKTISVIPTYSLISDGFENNQQMLISGQKRIKRAIRISVNSIQNLKLEDYQKYKQIDLLSNYVEKKEKEFLKSRYNKDNVINPIDEELSEEEKVLSHLNINHKNLTNLGLFRKFVELKLENNPLVSHKHSDVVVVRLLEGTKEGVGLEIYCFSAKSKFSEYEYLQATIFEQIYAEAPYFNLRITS